MLDIGYRYYYNGNTRVRRGVITTMNNMNYLTLVYVSGFYKESVTDWDVVYSSHRFVHNIGVAWGFQRNYNNRTSIDIYVGPGCTIGNFFILTMQGGIIQKPVLTLLLF